MTDHVHDWHWIGTRSASGTPTRDVYECRDCGEKREVPRDA